MAKNSETLDPEPVDAEFEPAHDDGPYSAPLKASSPGTALILTLFVIALFGGGLLGTVGARMFPASIEEDDPGLSAELAAQTRIITGFETRLSALENEDPAQTARSAVSGLETRLASLENAPAGNVDLNPIEARIDALETAPTIATDNTIVTALTQRLSTLEAANADTNALALQALETSAQIPPATTDPQMLENLSQRIFALETATGPVETDSETASQIAALMERTGELETALSQARSVADTAQQTANTTAETMASRPADTGDDARQLAARALALTALRDMAASGEAFEAERAALARLWRGNDNLAALASYSRAGVPTIDDLQVSFPEADIRETAGPGRAFFGLVEVRRSNPGESETGPLAITALAKNRLAENDLEGAVSLIESLDETSLEVAQSWLLTANARLDTDRRIAGLRQSLTRDAADQGEDPS